jgi:ATP-dependent Zn protease
MPDTSVEPAGLTPPDEGPTFGFKSRERLEDRTTRKPMGLWDRLKVLVLLVGLFFFFVLASTGDNPILPFREAVDQQLRGKWWLAALAALEVVRQIHYLISERSAGYHRFWSQKVFGGVARRQGRMNDWNRYRMGRALRFVIMLVVLAMVLGAVLHTSPIQGLVQLPNTIFSALPLIFQLFFAVAFIIIQFGAMFWFLSRGGMEVYFPDDIKTRFTDVWGQDSVLEKIKENIVFLEDPESIEKRGGYVPGGLLLWGPPGTGKTLMAEAVAGETGKPYVFVDPGAFTAMFMGVGILKVKSLFRKLRKLSVRYGGVIVFFDEADSLGSRGALTPGGVFGQMRGADGARGPWNASDHCNGLTYVDQNVANMTLRNWLDASAGPEPQRRWRDAMMPMGMGGGGMGTLQALLAEMSGLKKPKGFMNRVVRRILGFKPKPPPKYRMLIMMATNMPQSLDEALLRPGRIDRIYKVGYPSKPGRVRTYEGYLSKVSHQLTASDIDKLATITPYATGATIKDTVNEALINAIRNGRDTITWNDVVKAKQLKDLGPPEDVEYIERERHAVAVHEACHAVAAYRVRAHMTIDIATIEKGGTYLGMVASIPPEDQFTRWRSEYEADIIVSLASLVGERMFFDGDNSSGVSGDLETATQIATLMEGYWGMGSTVASHGVTQKVGIGGGGKPGKGEEKDHNKDLLEGTLGERIEDKLADLMDRTERLLKENRRAVLAVAHALETYKTVTGDDIQAIIDGRPGTLIDGTPYGTPEFDRMAEDYHNRVVAAHKGHGKVDIPLPLLNGRHRVVQARGDVLVETDISEAELADWGFRRPPSPPPDERSTNGNGNGTGNGSGEPATE